MHERAQVVVDTLKLIKKDGDPDRGYDTFQGDAYSADYHEEQI
jgi:hypothetical protein